MSLEIDASAFGAVGSVEAIDWSNIEEPSRDRADGPSVRLVLTPASTIAMRPVRWVWDTAPAGSSPSQCQGRFAEGSLVLGAGRAGIGKSQFAAWLAARVTKGTLPGSLYGNPRAVIYAASEDSWSMTIAPRLAAAGADLDRVFRVDVVSDDDKHARLTLPKHTSLLATALVERRVALLVLDPLLSLIDGGLNDYRAQEMRRALEPLAEIADRTGVLVYGLAHFTKAGGSDPLTAIAGSAAFGQVIRAAIGFARDDDDEHGGTFVLSTIKNNLGREDLPSLAYTIVPATVETGSGASYVSRFEFTGAEASRSVRELLAATASMDAEERSERAEAAEWLIEYLTHYGGEAKRTDVLKAGRAAGFSEATLKRARSKAGAEADRQGFAGGSVWRLRAHSAHHSGHSAQVSEGEPNEPNGEPNDSPDAQSPDSSEASSAIPTPLQLFGQRAPERWPEGSIGSELSGAS